MSTTFSRYPGRDARPLSLLRPRSSPRFIRGIRVFASWFLFLPALSAASCAKTAAQPAEPPPPKVTVAEVVSRDVTEWDEFTGRIEAVNTVSIRPRVSGLISAVRFDEGAIVRRGDLLYQIDPRPFQAEVDRLRAELLRARATVQRANSELERAKRLTAENAMSREEGDRRASVAHESAAQVGAVEAALRAAELNLEFTRVTSPIAGRVGRAIVTQGNLVSSGPGEATLLTTVVSLDPIYASFDAEERVFLRYQGIMRKGTRAAAQDSSRPIRMALASDEGFPREGRMDFLDNQLDPQTGTIRGRAVFRNPDGELTPGLFVRLQLAGGAHYRGLLIQDRAVGTDLGKKFVYVVGADNAVEYRTVTLGPLSDGLRVVQEGLKPGDRVIVNGLQRVRPGVKVAPEVVAMDVRPGGATHTAAGQ
jgi:RND family efflux transporter MFP subunit